MMKMKKLMMRLPFIVMTLLTILECIFGHPVGDEEQFYPATDAVRSGLIVSNEEMSNNDNTTNTMIKRKRVISKQNLPPSPVGLAQPDTFKFYTFNQNGEVVLKKMSENEIQSLIASSGEHIPIEIHEPQKVDNVISDETKVSDVVQNVRNVLKSELSKPLSVMASMPTIPGHDNSEWSNILPSILSGDVDSNISMTSDHLDNTDQSEIIIEKPTTNSPQTIFNPIKSEIHETKPMIPVAVITVEKSPSSYEDKEDKSEMPIFHILNTITADNESISERTNDTAIDLELDQMPGASETNISCLSTSSNCNNHQLEINKKPSDNLQNNHDELIKNHNNETNDVDIGYSSIKVELLNVTEKEEKPKPLTAKNPVEVIPVTQIPIKFDNKKEKPDELELYVPVITINKSDTVKNSTEVNDELTKLQSQVNIAQTTSTEAIQKIETTTVNSDSLPILQNSTQNDIPILHLNSSMIQQIVFNNATKNISILPTEKPEIVNSYETSLLTEENITQKPSEMENSSESVNITVNENISKINEKNSSVEVVLSHTTVTPLQQKIFTTSTPIQQTKENLNNSSLNTVSDESNEKSSLPTVATPNILEISSSNSTSKPTEQISIELSNSLSSVISQITEMLPSIVPTLEYQQKTENVTNKVEINDEISTEPSKNYNIKYDEWNNSENKTIDGNSTHKNPVKINQNATTTETLLSVSNEFENKFQSDEQPSEQKLTIEKDPETPIVRIDIMETMSNVDKNINETQTNKNKDNSSEIVSNKNEVTESPMVRIKLTDPVSVIHQILESSPVQSSTQNSIEIVTLPMNKNISANQFSSGLIAGFNSSTSGTVPLKNLESAGTAETNVIAENKTIINIDNTTEKSVTAMNITTISSTTSEQVEFKNITDRPVFNSSEVKTESLTESSSLNEVTSTIKTTVKEDIKVIKVTQPMLSTTISPHKTTEMFMGNETVKLNKIMNDTVITELPEVKVDEASDIAIPQVSNKTQLNEQLPIAHIDNSTPVTLIMQNVTEKIVESTTLEPKTTQPSTTLDLKLETQLNETIKQTSSYLQYEVPTTPKSLDVVKNNSAVTLTKIKDKKKDDSRLESLEKNEENSTIPSKPNNPLTPTPELEIIKKKNTTQDVKVTEKWTLIPQKNHSNPQTTATTAQVINPLEERIADIQKQSEKPLQTNALSESKGVQGLDSSVSKLDADIAYFSILCNNLAFTFWSAVNSDLSTSRSLSLSPFGMTSILAMIFLGARSPTSDRMNEVLKLDDVTSFNPHLVFQNITDSVSIAENQGISNVAFVRELFVDQIKVRKLMRFYKKQAEQFYDGMVEQVNFSTISDAVRRKTNFLIRKQTGGRIRNFIKTNTLPLRSPLAALSANVFQTDCNTVNATSKGRDGELYFAVSPAIRQRKLILVPATLWKSGVLAGYEPSLDATAIAIGNSDNIVSTIFVIPGQQGFTASNDNLDLLEQRIITGALHDGAWNKLLKVIVPRPGLELQIPKFSHKSFINATSALKTMGLEELFYKHADFKGINGVGNDFHLADVIQMNLFSTCGDENIQGGKTKHHVEIYPASPQTKLWELESKSQADNHEFNSSQYSEINSSSVRTNRQTNDNKPRVKLDKPFLYFVRHNPTGLILFMGRFNPRLLP